MPCIAFGNAYRTYALDKIGARLQWDGRDEWFVLEGGSPWRDLLIHRPSENETGIAIAIKLDTALAATSQDAPGARQLPK